MIVTQKTRKVAFRFDVRSRLFIEFISCLSFKDIIWLNSWWKMDNFSKVAQNHLLKMKYFKNSLQRFRFDLEFYCFASSILKIILKVSKRCVPKSIFCILTFYRIILVQSSKNDRKANKKERYCTHQIMILLEWIDNWSYLPWSYIQVYIIKDPHYYLVTK